MVDLHKVLKENEQAAIIVTPGETSIMGDKGMIVACITSLLNHCYEDKLLDEFDFNFIFDTYKINEEEIEKAKNEVSNKKSDRLKKINSLLDDIINNLKDEGEED